MVRFEKAGCKYYIKTNEFPNQVLEFLSIEEMNREPRPSNNKVNI
jgi:hypothetical protein